MLGQALADAETVLEIPGQLPRVPHEAQPHEQRENRKPRIWGS